MLKNTHSLRYFIEISFNGTNYHGWQIQPNAITVQEVLETCLSTLLRMPIAITGAGRTDAGVHASQIFAHFDFNDSIDEEAFVYKLNSFLPKDIAVKRIFKVEDALHARFNALSRTYHYKISLAKNPFATDLEYFLKNKPDVALMNEAAKDLLNYKNFKCFSRSNTDVKTYNCDIKEAFWEEKDGQLQFTITADRFLRNMVRAIVGTLLDVGYGKCSIANFNSIIQSEKRTNAGASAPAKGLYLAEVKYPFNG